MRLYEFVLVLKPSLSEADRTKLIDSIKEMFKGLKVTKEDSWGQKPLSYRMKKEVAGFFHLMNLEGEKGIEKGYEKRLITNDNILRYLMIRRK